MSRLSECFLMHMHNPRNVGKLDNYDKEWSAKSAYCLDTVCFTVKFNDTIIDKIKFRAYGCTTCIVAASFVTELVTGKKKEEVLQLSFDVIKNTLGPLPPLKERCIAFVLKALQNGLIL